MWARLEALSRSQAVIEFTPEGEVLKANSNFLSVMGYPLEDIQGRHHRMFVEPSYAQSPDYAQFWEGLRKGEFRAGLFKRIGSGDREVWIQASYNPVLDSSGRVLKIVKYTTDVTAEQERTAHAAAKLQAIDRSQGVIEFDLDGRIVSANRNFLDALGYSPGEIAGQHHAMFVEPAERQSDDYRRFWEKLRRGEFDSGKYKRVGKGGRTVWIQATYNPVLDASGRPVKVVKFAQIITEQVEAAQATERAVADVMRIVSAAANDDLSLRIDCQGKSGEFETLCAGVNRLMDTMSDVVGRMRDASDVITTSAKEIAAGNTDLSGRTEEQASSLEETASSMEELTSTVKQNADNARQANQLVVGASEVAQRGGDVVREVVQTMGGISESSKKIADIISVIDGIAFQTNILALNAAVEAARAGEQGRGFAVVATEVRNLAQRSAGAAKEIKELISDSVGKVESGSRLVDEAGRTMEEIVVSVKRVTDIMAEITAASVEQSAGIEQVNQAITQMDEVTQQNAALVEQAAAAAESLEEQAQMLSQAVVAFKLEQESQDTGPLQRRRAASTHRIAVQAA
ncbi:MAG: PAS domain-containing protein [Betaproteobacteria bacterium]|nr:PAS domain-containing protein [Betaproteobacteria bacterium]